jgi:hypothetical protein
LIKGILLSVAAAGQPCEETDIVTVFQGLNKLSADWDNQYQVAAASITHKHACQKVVDALKYPRDEASLEEFNRNNSHGNFKS